MTAIFGSGITFLFTVVLIVIILLWILTIIWAGRDAKARGASSIFAIVISLIPFLGMFAYVLLRPALSLKDKEEQELDILLKRAQLSEYIICPDCGHTLPNNYVACPFCGAEVKVTCTKCSKPLDSGWRLCPYCGNKHVGQLSSSPFSNEYAAQTSDVLSSSNISDSKKEEKLDIPNVESPTHASKSIRSKIKSKTEIFNKKTN